MSKLKNLSFVIALFIALSACENNSQKTQDSEDNLVAETQKEKESKNWVGVYKGNLPCASCEEIQTTLILDSNGTYELRSTYMSKEIETFVDNGTYTWDQASSEITLNVKDEKVLPKYKVEKGSLTLLNADGVKNTGKLADMYVLNKVEINNITGSYVKGEKEKGYYEELLVSASENGLYDVKINSGDTKKGCSFEAKGKLENNRILINLSEVDKNLTSKMVIEFTGNKASIYSYLPKDNYDLMYFCGGGGSLTGDYTKE